MKGLILNALIRQDGNNKMFIQYSANPDFLESRNKQAEGSKFYVKILVGTTSVASTYYQEDKTTENFHSMGRRFCTDLLFVF